MYYPAFFLPEEYNSIVNKSESDFLEVGKVTHAHGIKGEVFISLFSGFPLNSSVNIVDQVVQFRRSTELCLETTVQEARSHKKGIIARLKGVEERQKAETLKGACFFVPKKIFSSLSGENIYLCEILNFEVYDKKHGTLGKISSFSDNGAQDLLIVQSKKGNLQQVSRLVEIPFIKEFIVDIDFESKRICVDLHENWPGLEY